MKCAVLLSGGVDSSLVLARLVEQGVEVTAFYLKIWLEDELAFLGSCPWEEDTFYARAVCERFGVPFEVVPMQQAYYDRVIAYTIAEVRAGRTPNPDILCNQQIKFGAFYDCIGERFDKVASGHYAQVREIEGRYRLFSSPDPIKDQTYFLALLSQKQLSKALFPLGDLTKAEVRQEAEKRNLPNKMRPDSQGVCFLGKLKFSEFLKAHLGVREGELREFETGTVLGTHEGFWFYTIGQRQGIGLSGGPWYVVAKESEKNIVFISRHYYDADKKRDMCLISGCNWITGAAPLEREIEVKLRHGPKRYRAYISQKNPSGESLEEGRYRIQLLDEQDQGIALGQFVVIYDGAECLGGGAIERV